MSEWRDRLRREAEAIVRFDEPLAGKVAFRIGGPAEAYARPEDVEQLRTLLSVAREHGVPVTLLGSGSNVLISDLGVPGLVIRLAGRLAEVELPSAEAPERLHVGAGALNARAVSEMLRRDLVGAEFLATIPGTFGGALIMNAGAHGGEIGPFVEEVELLDAGLEFVRRPGSACGFAYRTSGFRPGEILTGAWLRVPRGDAEAARLHLREMRLQRRRTQPIGQPNAGSIFKNPPGDYAGRLIEACGLKGRRRGDAEISVLHANFIVNLGAATASDVVGLAAEARAAVAGRFGVELEWEVKRIGPGLQV